MWKARVQCKVLVLFTDGQHHNINRAFLKLIYKKYRKFNQDNLYPVHHNSLSVKEGTGRLGARRFILSFGYLLLIRLRNVHKSCTRYLTVFIFISKILVIFLTS